MGKNIYFVGNMPFLCNDIQCCDIQDVYDYCVEQEILAVDTETSGVDFNCEKVIMFQIGTQEKQFVIDTRYISIEPLRNVLESNTIISLQILTSFNILNKV